MSECDYSYSTTFTISEDIHQHSFQQLVFEGIDTYATIALNGKFLIRTSNAFRKYAVQVGGILKVGENVLYVRINSTKSYDQLGQTKNSMPF